MAETGQKVLAKDLHVVHVGHLFYAHVRLRYVPCMRHFLILNNLVMPKVKP